MNTPLKAPQNNTDLVLRLIGGEQDGQKIAVGNEKFLLSSLLPKHVDADKYRCAIFRGEKGVAFRSYSDAVLCNDVQVSVQWLNQGDVITLNELLSVEIFQLGVYKKPASSVAASPRQPAQTVAITPDLVPGPVLHPSALRSAQPSPRMPQQPSAVPFKPASNPLAEENYPSPQNPPATQTPGLRAPVNTYAVDVVPTKMDYVNIPQMPSETGNSAPLEASPTMDSAIDSLTKRLSKLVDIAGGSTDPDDREPETTELKNKLSLETGSTPEPVARTSSVTSFPEHAQPDVSPPGFPNASPAPATSEVKTDSTTPAATLATPPTAPHQGTPTQDTPRFKPVGSAAEAAASASDVSASNASEPSPPASPAKADSSPSVDAADESAKRRSALESYFIKSGVSLPDLRSKADSKADPQVANPVSPPVTQATDANAPSTTPSQPAPSVPAPASPAKPEFDLDAVLARLGSQSSPAVMNKVAPDQPPAPSSAGRSTEDLLNQMAPTAAAPSKPSVVFADSEHQDDSIATPVAAPINELAIPNEQLLPDAGQTAENERAALAESTAQSTAQSEMKSFALLQSLGLDTASLSDVKKELAQPDSSQPSPQPSSQEPVGGIESLAALPSQPTAETSAQPAPEPEPEPSESVADVLARMKSAGSFADFESEENDSAIQAVAPNDAPEPTPSAPTAAQSREQSPVAGDEDESVENYMSQLLNRMRSGKEPDSANEATAKEKVAAKVKPATPAVKKIQPQPVKAADTMTPEEFKPKQKAVRMQSLDSLREIANTSAREAFRDSVARERKLTTQTKLYIAMISLAFAVLFFLLSYMMQDKVNFWGVVCGIGFLIFGILTARTYLSERKLDESIISD